MFGLDTPLGALSGVGPAREKKLAGMGLHTVADLLAYYPRQYEDRRKIWSIRDAPEGARCCVEATVGGTPVLSRVRNGLTLVKAKAFDDSGYLELTFFNQPYRKNELREGRTYIFFGKVEGERSRKRMVNPYVEEKDRAVLSGSIVPIYALKAGVTNALLRSMTDQVLPCAAELPETVPDAVRREYGLLRRSQAVVAVHRPASEEDLAAGRRALSFEELFVLSTGLGLRKKERRKPTDVRIGDGDLTEFYAALPYDLTDAQKRAIGEIRADLLSGLTMNRLIQGDVGSGKTVIAAAAVYLVCRAGYQAALMAPTEILAQQHYTKLSALMDRFGIRTSLLTGSLSEKEKKAVRASMADGTTDFVIGTHALIAGEGGFQRPGLVITDEQHRFGVRQRTMLGEKGGGSHMLVMSATPIPRTLALSIYGDLDISVVDAMPPGRQKVKTYLVGENMRQRVFNFVRKLVGQGRQVYIVCPKVEDGSEESPTGKETAADLKAAETYADNLRRNVFPDLRIGLVHGRLKQEEKNRVMEQFADGSIDVLVSTTVIEVGVDVPNAVLMVVENAERFGLSQLHQLRGRVGRGQWQSYCILMAGKADSESLERLRVMTRTTDGFEIAQADLDLRGPGDFFGDRQHGLPQMQASVMGGNLRTMEEAREAADGVIAEDPELTAPEHAALKARIGDLFGRFGSSFN